MQLVLLQFNSAFTIKCSLCISFGFCLIVTQAKWYVPDKKKKCLFWLPWQRCILYIKVYSMDSRMCMQYAHNRQPLKTRQQLHLWAMKTDSAERSLVHDHPSHKYSATINRKVLDLVLAHIRIIQGKKHWILIACNLNV